MERLTKKGVSALGIYKTCCVNFRNAECECFGGDCTKCSTNEKVWDRLAAYEDTGLTPEEVNDIKRQINQRDAMNANQKTLLEAQQQELKQLKTQIKADKRLIKQLSFDGIDLRLKLSNLTADKDEQAGRIMRYDSSIKRLEKGLKQIQHDIDGAECRDDLDGIKGFIDALIGGKG